MIAKAGRGSDAVGLLRYLLNDNGLDEHVNCRVIHQQHMSSLDRVQQSTPERLGRILNAAAQDAGWDMAKGPIYHLSISTARVNAERGLPADRPLSDQDFATVSADMLRRVGLGDCMALSVRHDQAGKEHAHVAAVMVNSHGRRVTPWKDHNALRAGCRQWEQDLGLRVTAWRAPRETHAERAAARQYHALRLKHRHWQGVTPETVARRVYRVTAAMPAGRPPGKQQAAQFLRLMRQLERLVGSMERAQAAMVDRMRAERQATHTTTLGRTPSGLEALSAPSMPTPGHGRGYGLGD